MSPMVARVRPGISFWLEKDGQPARAHCEVLHRARVDAEDRGSRRLCSRQPITLPYLAVLQVGNL